MRFNKGWLIFSAIIIVALTVVFVLDDATVIGQFLDFLEYPFLATVGILLGRKIIK